MNEQQSIRVYEHADELYRMAATFVAEQIRSAIDNRGQALIALSGGSLTSRLYPLLANAPLREQIDWSRVSIVFADERYVPLTTARTIIVRHDRRFSITYRYMPIRFFRCRPTIVIRNRQPPFISSS